MLTMSNRDVFHVIHAYINKCVCVCVCVCGCVCVQLHQLSFSKRFFNDFLYDAMEIYGQME